MIPTTLSRRAESALERLGDHPSLWFEGVWQSSYALAARARRAAAGFVALGVRPGDRVVLFAANCPEVPITYAALWRAGAVATPVLFLLTQDELRHVLTDSGAVCVVTTPEFLATVRAVAGGLPVVVVGGEASAGVTTFAELESGTSSASSTADPTTWPHCSTPAAPPAAARVSPSATRVWTPPAPPRTPCPVGRARPSGCCPCRSPTSTGSWSRYPVCTPRTPPAAS